MKLSNSMAHPRALATLALITTTVVAASPGSPASAAAHRATSAPSITGVVIAIDHVRHTALLTNAAGKPTTIRTHAALRVGQRIHATLVPLADGTFQPRHLRGVGHATSAHVHAVVAKVLPHALELSSANSTFIVATTTHGRQAHTSSTVAVGTELNVGLSVQGGHLDSTSQQTTGTSSIVTLDGAVTALTSTSITITPEGGASTTVDIPSSVTLPSTIVVGSLVESSIAVSGTTFTLVTLTADATAATQTGSGVNPGDSSSGMTRIEGTVVAADATSLTIQPGDNAAAIVVTLPTTPTPATAAAATVAVGDHVNVLASTSSTGVETLVSIRVDNSSDNSSASAGEPVEVHGVVVTATPATSTTPGTLVVQPRGGAAQVSVNVPTTIDISTLTAGVSVELQADLTATGLTLVRFHTTGEPTSDNLFTNVEGTLTALSATSLTIQPSDQAAPIDVAIPATLDVAALSVGASASLHATLVAGVLTLVSFELSNSSSSNNATMGYGVVTQISATSVTIAHHPGEGDALELVVPSSLDVSNITVGELVSFTAQDNGDTTTLVSITPVEQTTTTVPTTVPTPSGQQIYGVVTEVSSSDVTLTFGDANDPRSISLPAALNVYNLSVGERVVFTVQDSNGTYTVTSIAPVNDPTTTTTTPTSTTSTTTTTQPTSSTTTQPA